MQQELQGTREKLQFMGNPWVNDDMAKLNAFMKKHEITDVNQAVAVMGVKAEDLQNDPIKTLVLSQKMEAGSGSLSDSTLENAVRERYGYTKNEDGTETWAKQSQMEVDHAKALNKIQSMQGDVEIPNLIEQSQQQVELAKENRQKAINGWKTVASQIAGKTKSIPVAYGSPESPFTYEHQVPQELLPRS